MQQKMDFQIVQLDYSKELSECSCGKIVDYKGQRYLLTNIPDLSEKEKGFYIKLLEEIKTTQKELKKRGDIYFFLKEYCLENLVLLNKEQREKILNLLEWECINESVLTPLLCETDFEEIVINGQKKPLMVYHRIFGWLTTNIQFENEEKIKTLINKMASPLGRQLSYHTPLINAVLKNGSRLNASMNPIAFSGINATIRKFKENPLTPLNIIDYGTINTSATAFLWLAMQTSCSILICGNTGSGKTTTLNALFCFLPKDERVIVAEETPELTLPQTHTIKLNTAEQVNVNLGTLIDNTFRMRPDRVIVGEIRNKEEANAFVNTMLAGQARGSYATFHAESALEAIQRLKSFGIEERVLASIDLIIVQKRINLIEKNNRREERRVTEICETVKDEGILQLRELFKYSFEKKNLEKKNESTQLMDKISKTFSKNNKEIKKLIKEKEKILSNLQKDITFWEFFNIAEREG
ncbi:MAG: ATPase, T2SS/T4P/T4SS family [Candidatus ainarchaeum sp.]|jgi:archaeal flagellar protein FlaI|nr:ATPase, T2SS/T4P/T4SS family [Candidatus ainarchaeum sp.]MDD4128455.1 ATPase, T2SS/T4P/T4SS family [Candidatus ainarchaeum sp.]MDD4467951.1 ATPase, T2SS/T4P/T4SS family [Candidatus ainarchaeum sp.]